MPQLNIKHYTLFILQALLDLSLIHIFQAEKPEDFVIATGKQHSVREFAQLAFHYVGIELKWEGKRCV